MAFDTNNNVGCQMKSKTEWERKEVKWNELNKNKHTHTHTHLYRRSEPRGGQTNAWETKLNWIAWHDDSGPTPRLISQSWDSAFRSGYAIESGTRLQGNAPTHQPPTSSPPPQNTLPHIHQHTRLLWAFVCDFWVKFYSNLFALRWQKELLSASPGIMRRGVGYGCGGVASLQFEATPGRAFIWVQK